MLHGVAFSNKLKSPPPRLTKCTLGFEASSARRAPTHCICGQPGQPRRCMDASAVQPPPPHALQQYGRAGKSEKEEVVAAHAAKGVPAQRAQRAQRAGSRQYGALRGRALMEVHHARLSPCPKHCSPSRLLRMKLAAAGPTIHYTVQRHSHHRRTSCQAPLTRKAAQRAAARRAWLAAGAGLAPLTRRPAPWRGGAAQRNDILRYRRPRRRAPLPACWKGTSQVSVWGVNTAVLCLPQPSSKEGGSPSRSQLTGSGSIWVAECWYARQAQQAACHYRRRIHRNAGAAVEAQACSTAHRS